MGILRVCHTTIGSILRQILQKFRFERKIHGYFHLHNNGGAPGTGAAKLDPFLPHLPGLTEYNFDMEKF